MKSFLYCNGKEMKLGEGQRLQVPPRRIPERELKGFDHKCGRGMT